MKTHVELTQPKIDASILPPVSGTSEINVGVAERIISVVSGAALATYSLRNIQKASSWPMLLSGGYMIFRGATGYCPVNTMMHRNTATRKSSAVEASGTYIINRPRQEVYAFWRQFENLPRFMNHLKEVNQIDDTLSTWQAYVPGGLGTVSWQAEILEDQPGEYLSWSSMPGSTVDNAGSITFMDAGDSRTTEISVRITYRLPAGDIGGLAAKLINPVLEKMIMEDLSQLKRKLENDDWNTDELVQFKKERGNSKKS